MMVVILSIDSQSSPYGALGLRGEKPRVSASYVFFLFLFLEIYCGAL